MQADDLMLKSCHKCELELMLNVSASLRSRVGMCVDADKTELLAVRAPGSEPTG